MSNTLLATIRVHKSAITALLLLLMVSCAIAHNGIESDSLINQQNIALMNSAIDSPHCQDNGNCSQIASLGLSLSVVAIVMFSVLFLYRSLLPSVIARSLNYASLTDKLCLHLLNYPRSHALFCSWLN